MDFLDDDLRDMATEAAMKFEALKRMEIQGFSENDVNMFRDNGTVLISDYPLLREPSDEEKKIIEDYEKQSGCLVYHVIHSFSNIGETYELFRVSNYLSDWKYEKQRLSEGIVLVHAINMTTPEYTESGSVMVKRKGGVFFRIA